MPTPPNFSAGGGAFWHTVPSHLGRRSSDGALGVWDPVAGVWRDLAGRMEYAFQRNNLPASQTALLLLAPQNVSGYTVYKAGVLVALTALFTGTFNVGTLTARVRKNGTADTTLVLGPISAGTGAGCVAAGTGVSLAVGDYLQLEVDTSATFNGTAGVWGFGAVVDLSRH